MAIVINTNVASLNAQRHLSNTQFGLSKALERLSSGFRINRAGDDAAGLAISERLKAQIRSTSQASRNTLDGVSLVQVSEGGYDEVSSTLIRLRELAVQSANGTISATDRGAIDTEYDQLTAEITPYRWRRKIQQRASIERQQCGRRRVVCLAGWYRDHEQRYHHHQH